jgi:hypothetical protein
MPYKLRKPVDIRQEDFIERTYREIVKFKGGVGECKLEQTRDTLIQAGFIDITDGEPVTRKNLAKRKKKKSGGKKEGVLDKAKKIAKKLTGE